MLSKIGCRRTFNSLGLTHAVSEDQQEIPSVALYFVHDGRYVSCGHMPLVLQANQALALYLMEKSLGEKR